MAPLFARHGSSSLLRLRRLLHGPDLEGLGHPNAMYMEYALILGICSVCGSLLGPCGRTGCRNWS